MKYQWLTFFVFSSIIAGTMYITYWASKRVKSTKDFYAAGNSISGLQNGWAIAGDLYVNVLKDGKATQGQQMKAVKIASICVGIIAILIGILTKGQNVAHLVGMAFAVAASSNLPAIFLTLYWKKCNTTGVVMGMVVGAGAAILLVLLSPNVTYPQKIVAEANLVINGRAAQSTIPAKASEGLFCELFTLCQNAEPEKAATPLALPASDQIVKLKESLSRVHSESVTESIKNQITLLEMRIEKANADIAKFSQPSTSIMNLKEPLFRLKNLGIISIPLGFLMVIFFITHQ
jgi:cation/acetate symporter